MILAVGSLPILLLELERDTLIHHDRVFLDVVNVAVLIAFAVDYIVRLALTDNRARYVRTEWAALLIVITQALALVPALSAFGVLRVLRAGRALRAVVVVARVLAVGGTVAKSGRDVLRRHAASYALGAAGLTWIRSAVAFTLAEDVGENGRINSFGDAIWWSSATITTVGYGDVFPITATGRVVGVITMVVGISTFAVVTAKVAEFLVHSDA